ncbi:MAG: CHRD domain-containing protein [Chitinophagaceae bacterium]
MKKFYSNFLLLRVKKTLLLFFFMLGTIYATNAQVYTASLSGLNEASPNLSPGTGSATVTIVGNTMRVQATFSGLVSGGTTASHIHATTAVAGTGNAGVATTLPSFPGFPLGVRSGSFDMTYDMTLASSYNPSFIAANGGTPASAFAALKAAMNSGKSYYNIHSIAFPGGEIRGFLIACPTITVSIPDAFALNKGVLPNTVYPAYAPAASITLTASASGGTGPYMYTWSTGDMTSSITVSPTVTTQYTVTVTDKNGCSGTATKTVTVMDISAGKNDDKIIVCHKGHNSLTIAAPAVSAHLGHGDMLGSCMEGDKTITLPKSVTQEQAGNLSVQALRNPSSTYFDLQIKGSAANNIQVKVFDLMGRIIESKASLQANQTLRLGASYKPGVYMVQIIQGANKESIRLLKEK